MSSVSDITSSGLYSSYLVDSDSDSETSSDSSSINSILKSLVSKGTITQDQADSISEVISDYSEASSDLYSLDSLVSGGKLTEDQASRIKSTISEQVEAFQNLIGEDDSSGITSADISIAEAMNGNTFDTNA